MIIEKIDEAKQGKIKSWPVRSNRASAVGFPCERKLVYDRTMWEKKALHDIGLQYIFDEGNIQEKAVIDDLREAGFQIIEGQRPFDDKELQLTGHIDLKLKIDDKIYPTEIKGLSPYSWNELNSFEDFLKNKRVYVRGYASQMTLYLYLTECEEGIMLIRNKLTGRYKEILVKLDWELADGLVKKLQRMNKHLKAGTLPERMPYDPDVCSKCDFRHICVPESNNPSQIEMMEVSELEARLNRRAELDPLAKEFKALDKDLKEIVKSEPKDNIIIGNWILSKKTTKGKSAAKPPAEWIRTTVKFQKLEGE